jgi:excisionase family DNA binding protein
MTMTRLTPQQAAERAGVSRGTIMNAIKDSSLSAFRDNRNRWQIPIDKLSDWMSERSEIATVSIDSSLPPRAEENQIRIAVLEAELRSKNQRISDLEHDRDSWKEQAQSLARRRPRRWWPF